MDRYLVVFRWFERTAGAVCVKGDSPSEVVPWLVSARCGGCNFPGTGQVRLPCYSTGLVEINRGVKRFLKLCEKMHFHRSCIVPGSSGRLRGTARHANQSATASMFGAAIFVLLACASVRRPASDWLWHRRTAAPAAWGIALAAVLASVHRSHPESVFSPYRVSATKTLPPPAEVTSLTK